MGFKKIPSLSLAVMILFCIKTVSSYVINMTRTCVLNHSCELPCKLEIFSNVNVFWFNGNNEMLTRGKQIVKYHRDLRIEKPAYDEWVLHINRVNRKFADDFYCKTSDGITLSEITVVIEQEPRVDEQSSSSSPERVQEHTIAQLHCAFTGTPEPEILWYRGLIQKRIIEGLKGPKLIIQDVERYASDEYTCTATNKHGTASIHIKLVVEFSPEATVMESEVSATGGERVIMGCAVQGSPLHGAFWTNNKGERIEQTSWDFTITIEEESETFPVRFLKLELKKAIFSMKYEGVYTCHGVAENSESTDDVRLKYIT